MLLRRSKQINTKKLSSIKTNKKDHKKIGFLSGVMFIISTVIGVGIFLKNGQILSLNLGNFTLSILAWIITSITVISLGLSLLVIAAKTNSDLGILQWAKDFLSPKIFETIKFYFLFIYIPLIVCGDAYYFLQSLQQAFPSWHLHWYITWIITFLVIMYFVIVNTLKPFMIMVHAYIAFYIKLIPIFFFAIIAFIFYFVNYDNVQETTKQLYALNDSGFIHPNQDDLNSYFYKNPMLIYGPEIGFFLSIPAMFFTYDGFYYVVSIKKQLKDPKQSPKIILIGMICLAVIFILITLSLLWSTSAYDENGGTILGVKYLHSTKVWRAINAVLNIAICIGCLGILSGSINFSSCLYKEILLCHDLPFAKTLLKRTKWSMNKLLFIYLYSYLFVFFFVISFIGTFGFLNLYGYDFGYSANAKINQLYSFINVITNWESLFTFATFVFIILGSFVAMKKKKITFKKTKQKIFFMLEGILIVSVIGFAVVFAIIHAFGNFIIVLSHSYFYDKNSAFYNLSNLIGTKIILSNHEIYSSKLLNNELVWINKKNQVLNENSKIIINKIIANLKNLNPYLFGWYINFNDYLNHQILAKQIIDLNNIKNSLFNNNQSIYIELNQDFVGEIINFCILIVIITSCLIYTNINSKNKLKHSWFNIPDNIFHNKALELHM